LQQLEDVPNSRYESLEEMGERKELGVSNNDLGSSLVEV